MRAYNSEKETSQSASEVIELGNEKPKFLYRGEAEEEIACSEARSHTTRSRLS